ncbi:serine protease [Actinacidiphila yanglinensis]|nr:serine protease [Actinacidiphila yanglinensis]
MEAEGGVGGGNSLAAPTWAVRIRRGDGTIAGAGVLVDPEWVLTHAGAVVEGEYVTAEFVGTGCASQRAVADQVCAPDAGGVALLRLDRSGPAGAASTLRRLSVPHRSVRMYGFPAVDGPGDWLAAGTERVAGSPDGRVRLAVAEPASAGFHGAGVTDATTGELVGVALPADPGTNPDRDGDHAGPYMSPAETVAHHLSRAAGWTRGWAAVDERLRVAREGEPAVFHPDFARRLADWLRGDRPRSAVPPPRPAAPSAPAGGPAVPAAPPSPAGPVRSPRPGRDGRQVKISQVRDDDSVRAATLRRALLLADRELRGPVRVSPQTDPPPGGLDLAVDATGRHTLWIADRVADRLGVLPEGPEAIDGGGPDLPVRRILAAPATLTLVVVGVDQAADPDSLLDLLALLRTRGDRMLLVFRHDGAHYARAQSQLVIEPSQQRQALLVGRLNAVTGALATALHEAMAEVAADCDRALEALVKAHAVRTTVAGTAGVVAGLGQDPDLGRFERVADRAERRIKEAVDRLGPLIERRDELIGRLDSYQVLHQEALDSEDLAAEDLYLAAYDLLHARPCDLEAAEIAMRAYADFIERWSSRHPPGDESKDGTPRPSTDPGEVPAQRQDQDPASARHPDEETESGKEPEPDHAAGPKWDHAASPDPDRASGPDPNHVSGASPDHASDPDHASGPDQEGDAIQP